METTTLRPLHEIAAEINNIWPQHRGTAAEPYVNALTRLERLTDRYGSATAAKAVSYFLNTASEDFELLGGPAALRIRAELKEMIAD